MAIFERKYQNFGSKCGRKNAKFRSKTWLLVAKMRWSLNSMITNSKKCREGFKVVVRAGLLLRWSGLGTILTV